MLLTLASAIIGCHWNECARRQEVLKYRWPVSCLVHLTSGRLNVYNGAYRFSLFHSLLLFLRTHCACRISIGAPSFTLRVNTKRTSSITLRTDIDPILVTIEHGIAASSARTCLVMTINGQLPVPKNPPEGVDQDGRAHHRAAAPQVPGWHQQRGWRGRYGQPDNCDTSRVPALVQGATRRNATTNFLRDPRVQLSSVGMFVDACVTDMFESDSRDQL